MKNILYLLVIFLLTANTVTVNCQVLTYQAEPVSPDKPRYIGDIAYCNGRYVAVGDNGIIITSKDIFFNIYG